MILLHHLSQPRPPSLPTQFHPQFRLTAELVKSVMTPMLSPQLLGSLTLPYMSQRYLQQKIGMSLGVAMTLEFFSTTGMYNFIWIYYLY